MATVEQRLADLLVDGAARRQRGESVAGLMEEAGRLAIDFGADADPEAFGRFFELLATRLAATGTKLPPVEELPASIAPIVAAFGHTFAFDKEGMLDFERTARRAERAMEQKFGTSVRKRQRAEQRARIRRDVSASVAESLRQHGLTPACDADDD